MSLYKKRIDKVWEKLKEIQKLVVFGNLSPHEKVVHNCRFLLFQREGEYLIKVSRNNKRCYCGDDQMYVDFTYTGDWFALSNRKEAQWFSGKEAHELITTKFRKGFSIVKKHNRQEI